MYRDACRVESDETLMLAVGSGDLEAFEQIVQRYQGEAWRVAYRFTGDAAEAEDLAQEAFMRVLNAAARYRPTAKFRTWFYRILTRLCLDSRRKRRPVLAPPPDDEASHSPSPLQQASEAERDRFIQAALDALPVDHRMAVVLRYFEGLSAEQMAAAMGRSVKAVERLLARGRAALKPRLEALLTDETPE